MDKTIISIEGNIGSGKSTLVENLRKYFVNNPKVYFLQEPIDLWNTIRDENGITILQNFYADQRNYAFAFQMMAYISRLKLLREAFQNKSYDIIITERSIFTDRHVFAQMLYDDKKMEKIEYSIYMQWFDEFIQDFPPLNIVYIKTDPKVAEQRVLKRNRQGEDIPLAYLQRCHNYHETWLANDGNWEKIIELDGNVDCKENKGIVDCWINEIKKLMN